MGDGKPSIDQQWLAHAALYWLQRRPGFAAPLRCSSRSQHVVLRGRAELRAAARRAQRSRHRWGGARPRAHRLQGQGARADAGGAAVRAHAVDRAPAPRTPRWRTPLVLTPVVVVWANVHGSALLASALVCSCGVARMIDGGSLRLQRAHAMDALTLLASLGALFASPYGLRLASYYHDTLTNPLFRTYLKEWQPPDWSEGSFLIVIGSQPLPCSSRASACSRPARSWRWRCCSAWRFKACATRCSSDTR